MSQNADPGEHIGSVSEIWRRRETTRDFQILRHLVSLHYRPPSNRAILSRFASIVVHCCLNLLCGRCGWRFHCNIGWITPIETPSNRGNRPYAKQNGIVLVVHWENHEWAIIDWDQGAVLARWPHHPIGGGKRDLRSLLTIIILSDFLDAWLNKGNNTNDNQS